MVGAVRRVDREAMRGPDSVDTRRTLARMAQYVTARASDPRIRYLAADLVRDLPPRDSARQVDRLRGWLSGNFRFLPDPVRDELVIDPVLLVAEAAQTGTALGDCDDAATLAASLGQSIGLPARFVTIAVDGGPMSHVWTELWDGAEWRELDTTAVGVVGGRRPGETARWEIPLYGVAADGSLGLSITLPDLSNLDLDAPLWFGLQTKTWLMVGGGVVLLLLLRR